MPPKRKSPKTAEVLVSKRSRVTRSSKKREIAEGLESKQPTSGESHVPSPVIAPAPVLAQKNPTNATKSRKKATNKSQSNNTAASTVHRKPLLVVLPGASGCMGKGMSTVFIVALEKHFRVCVREGKWKGWNPAGDSNVQSVLDLCPTEDIGDWYIMGNSFGNRVLCAMFSGNRSIFPCPPKGLVMFGYPMYGPRGTNERVNLLQELELNDDQNVLLISGEKDEFLLRKGSKAADVYAAVVKGMAIGCDQVEVKIVPGGKHGVLDHPKDSALLEASDTALSWVLNFFNL